MCGYRHSAAWFYGIQKSLQTVLLTSVAAFNICVVLQGPSKSGSFASRVAEAFLFELQGLEGPLHSFDFRFLVLVVLKVRCL